MIAFSKTGNGPSLILVDGALCSRSFGPMPKLAAQLTPHFTVYTYDRRGRGDSGESGESGESGDTPPYEPEREVDDIEALAEAAGTPVYVHGTSSGSALALEAAKRVNAITKLAVYEPPFVVDGTKEPMPDDFVERMIGLLAEGRRGDVVRMFMRLVGTPAVFTTLMACTPVWRKLKAVAHTLPYDMTLMQDHQRGTPFAAGEWDAVKIPVLVGVGGKSPAWITNGTRALADALPDAEYRVLPGQNHMVRPQAIAPVLADFYARSDSR